MKRTNSIMKLILLFLFCISSIFSQNAVDILSLNKNGTISFALVNKIDSTDFKNSIEFLKSVLKCNKKIDFYLFKIDIDEQGNIHEAYQQTFNGFKVEHAEYLVHKNNEGIITCINGNFESIPEDFDTTPISTFEEVFYKMNPLRSTISLYSLLDLPETVLPKPNSLRATGINRGQTEMVIVRADDEKFYFTYKANLASKDKNENFLAYFDNKTGDIISKVPLIINNNIGRADTRYSGSRSITTTQENGRYKLFETNRKNTNSSIYTRNNNGNSITDFWDNDNNWSANEHGIHNVALDVHWGAEMTIDYFKEIHFRNGYDNRGAPLISNVHYPGAQDNAFWSPSEKQVFFGDGQMQGPLVSLDVVAHEIGHAVCNYSVGNNVGLNYSGESGALNESLSDIWGACVEKQYAPEKETWIMGEDAISGGIRSMSNPKSSLITQPNTYKQDYWVDTNSSYDNGGVHINSGVGNYWFYLLSEGGQGTNDLGNSYKVTGIGILKASKIVYKMETNYLTSTSGYSAAYNASIRAATDLYGGNSSEVISVINAWYAVGIGSNFAIYGKDLICANHMAKYEIVPSPGNNIVWTCSANLRITPLAETAWISTVQNQSGNGWVKATFQSGSQTYNLTCNIWVAEPDVPEFNFRETNNYLEGIAWIPSPKEGISYRWETSPSQGVVISPSFENQREVYIRFPREGVYTILCWARNSCAERKTAKYKSVTVSGLSKSVNFSTYLDVTSKMLEIEFNNIEDPITLGIRSNLESLNNLRNNYYKIQFYNLQGLLVKTIESDQTKTKIDVSDLINGIYILHINKKESSTPPITKKISIHY